MNDPFTIEGTDGWRLTVTTEDQPVWPDEDGGIRSVAVFIENEAEDIGHTVYLDPVEAERFGDRMKRAAREAMAGGGNE